MAFLYKLHALHNGFVGESKVKDGLVIWRNPKDESEVILQLSEARANAIALWNHHRQKQLGFRLERIEIHLAREMREVEAVQLNTHACPFGCDAVVTDIDEDFQLHAFPFCSYWKKYSKHV